MNIASLPAFISLIFNLVILAHLFRGGRVSKLFLWLIIIFACHNAIEFIGFINGVSTEAGHQSIELMFRLYYGATIFVILAMFLHATSVSKTNSNLVTIIFSLSAFLISFCLLFTDLIVSGYYSIGYSVSAEKGPLFQLFSFYVFVALFGGAYVTFKGYRTAASQIESVRCFLSLMALAPMTLVCVMSMLFKILDLPVNATGLIPIATTLFLIIVLKTESKHRLSDLRRVMPLSLERQTTARMMDLLDEYIQNQNQKDVYKDLQAGIEKEIINYSLEKCDNNVTATSKMMGLKNRSTLYSMMNRLGIDISNLKENPTK